MMAKDFESAIIDVGSDQGEMRLGMISQNKEFDGKPADRIDFTTLNHLVMADEGPQTDLCEVGYQLVEHPENSRFKLFRRDDAMPDEELTDGGFSHEMAGNVAAFDIIFQNETGAEFEFWNTTEGEHAGKLPSLITIKLTLVDDKGLEYVFTTSVHPALAGRRAGE